MGIYVGCLSVGGSAAEVFRRCGSAFRAEGWRALEELGVEGDGELAKLAGWARQCLHLGGEGWAPCSSSSPPSGQKRDDATPSWQKPRQRGC